MADFSKPTEFSDHLMVLPELKAMIESCARMFDGTIDTNVPVGAIRYNSATSRIEKFNGTSWTPQSIGHVDAGSIGKASIQADAVDETKILLSNNQWLRAKAADGTALNMLRASAVNDTDLNAAPNKQLNISQGGAWKWTFQAQSFDFLPNNSDEFSIGKWGPSQTSRQRVKRITVKEVEQVVDLNNNEAPITIGPYSNHPFRMRTNNQVPYEVFGHSLIPQFSDCDIGTLSKWIQTAHTSKVLHPNGTLILEGSSGVILARDEVGHWQLSDLGALEPIGGKDVGTANSPVFRLTARNVSGTGQELSVGTTTNHDTSIVQNGAVRIRCRNDGHIWLDNQPLSATAGGVVQYLTVVVHGNLRRIPLHAV